MEQSGQKGKKTYTVIGIIIVIFITGMFIFYKKNINIEKENSTFNEPPFTKEGTLAFLSKEKNDTIKTIDIEIADNAEERVQGLMWRRSMSDSVGMLFIFEKEEPQSFWMKNTYIPLDLIFVNKAKKITSIHDYAVPLSEWSITSDGPAQFVVEVSAGFCFKYKINKEDEIKFTLQE